MKKQLLLICVIIIFSISELFSQGILEKFTPIIKKGNFNLAMMKMKEEICKNQRLSQIDLEILRFEIERLERVKLDFNKNEEDIIKYIKKYIPNIKKKDLGKWEKERSLECMMIDGKKKYFYNAAPNLFRINKECKKIKEEYNRKNNIGKDEDNSIVLLKEIVEESSLKKTSKIKPVRYQVDYSIFVDSNAVPEGEIIRCWLPYPRELPDKQEDIKLLSTFPEEYLISDNNKYMQRSIYFQQPARKDKKTEFKISYQYTCYAIYNKIEPERVKPFDESSEEFKKFTAERPPHIVFTKEIRELSKKIIGNETNPYLKAKKIFEWVDENIPWASAREYSTLLNIPMYAYENKHGDCGIQTLLFMTLARLNGIPTRWQSGWVPTSMHDWSYMKIEPYGWVPVDQSYGIQKSDDNNIRYFYLGSFENKRLVINDDYSVGFYPSKIYPRSETVDFQRGEVEWRGGNLYFNKWDYKYSIKEVE